MRGRKRWWVLAVGMLFLLISIAGIYGRSMTSVTNEVETGIVKIDLSEYQRSEDGSLEEWEDNPLIMPGADISKIPVVTNLGVNCYVRIRLDFEEMAGLDADCLYGLNDELVYHEDGFYYLHRALDEGETFTVFEGLLIPEEFSQENEEAELTFFIQADAIQERNVAADFESAMPWGIVTIEEQEMENGLSVRSVSVSDALVLNYQAEAKALMINAGDLFEAFDTLLPGDVHRESVALCNSAEREMRLYFASRTEDESELIENIRLQIKVQVGEQVTFHYDGSLKGEELQKEVLLAKIPAGGEGVMEFSLTVPAELGNAYSQQKSAVTWIFSTEEIPEHAAPYTGDNVAIGGIILAMCAALGGILLCLWMRRRGETDEETD